MTGESKFCALVALLLHDLMEYHIYERLLGVYIMKALSYLRARPFCLYRMLIAISARELDHLRIARGVNVASPPVLNLFFKNISDETHASWCTAPCRFVCVATKYRPCHLNSLVHGALRLSYLVGKRRPPLLHV